ncbi:MAG TPA: hypothetical protein VE981_18225 [Planctomycetota bacterium]|nr:hypothetical protein [Planctomycetota bacterium]
MNLVLGYLLGFLGTVVLAGMSWAFAFVFNPFTMLFVACAAPFIRLCGKLPASQGWGGMGTFMWTSIFWPLTLAPLHLLNYQILKWPHWGYAGLFAGTGILVAFIVMLFTSSSVP